MEIFSIADSGGFIKNRTSGFVKEPQLADECARAVLEKLKQDIKAKGDLSIVLAQAMAASVAQIISNLEEARESDFTKLSLEFDNLVRQADGSPYIKELILRAGKGYLNLHSASWRSSGG
jgi:hypothetical protein